jgi:hypothetical protein
VGDHAAVRQPDRLAQDARVRDAGAVRLRAVEALSDGVGLGAVGWLVEDVEPVGAALLNDLHGSQKSCLYAT